MQAQNIIAEQWKDIKNYENEYQISSLGRVKSKRSKKIMSTNKTLRGYSLINFSVNKSRKVFYIHRMVAEHFLENKGNYKTVDHIDENKKNNTITNLQWCSQSENMKLFHKRRLQKNRIQKHMILCEKDVLHIRRERDLFNVKATKLSIGYGVSLPLIYRIISRRSWKTV